MTDEVFCHPPELRMMRHLLTYPPHVLDAMAIDTQPGVTLHVSPVDTIESFVPRTCKRTMLGEDVLVPRVCTATTLLGCLRGYAVTVRDFLKARATNAGDDDWRGGYYIYAIPYEVSAFPGPALCPMAQWVQERWLLPYDGPETTYEQHIVGKVFIHTARGGGPNVRASCLEVEFFVEVFDSPIVWDHTRTLAKGYHGLTLPNAGSYFDQRFDEADVVYRTVTPKEYMARKGLRAELLSYSPASQWGHRLRA